MQKYLYSNQIKILQYLHINPNNHINYLHTQNHYFKIQNFIRGDHKLINLYNKSYLSFLPYSVHSLIHQSNSLKVYP